MTPAPVWSRLLVTLAACATLSLGLRDVLAPGLVLNFVPGDVHVQAVWASVGEGWAALHAQQMAGACGTAGVMPPAPTGGGWPRHLREVAARACPLRAGCACPVRPHLTRPR